MKNGTKNKMINLNDHLFEQLERINDDDLNDSDLKKEIARAKAMSGIANQIINNARVAVDAAKAFNEGLIKEFPPMLGMEAHDEIP